jgi:hypothetical protein
MRKFLAYGLLLLVNSYVIAGDIGKLRNNYESQKRQFNQNPSAAQKINLCGQLDNIQSALQVKINQGASTTYSKPIQTWIDGERASLDCTTATPTQTPVVPIESGTATLPERTGTLKPGEETTDTATITKPKVEYAKIAGDKQAAINTLFDYIAKRKESSSPPNKRQAGRAETALIRILNQAPANPAIRKQQNTIIGYASNGLINAAYAQLLNVMLFDDQPRIEPITAEDKRIKT